jgi:hypothetical protein
MRTLPACGDEIFSFSRCAGVNLGRMETAATDASSNTNGFPPGKSFAGVLASMAVSQEPDPAWNDDALAADVATISYEPALRTRGRSRLEVCAPQGDAAAVETPGGGAGREKSEAGADPRPLKTASITVRFSAPENVQVRRRAAEAGLTVSAYLRSCTLEVEILRTQVKDTLAELRSSREVSVEPCRMERTPTFQNALQRLGHWFRQFGPGRRTAIRVNPANPFAPVPN